MTSISLNVYITPFAEKGVQEASKWTGDSAKEALSVVNGIWSKANVAFVIANCVVDKPLDMAASERAHDQRLLDILSLRHAQDNQVHIYLVARIPNLVAGGASYLNSDPEPASFVQFYDDATSNGRAWAHELGHLMSLDHVTVDYSNPSQAAINNLMRKDLSMGKDLTDQQIGAAQGSKLVKRFGG